MNNDPSLQGHVLSPRNDAFYIVGVGASAGGLEALEEMFAKMPPDPGMAFVVVQHLSPDFESHMDDLLGRKTKLPTQLVVDGVQVQPNQIYLIPPGKELIIVGGKLILSDKSNGESPKLPIDSFLRSLANDAGSKSVGVILSGTGTDGSRGIRDIHAAGGLVICQDPETAKFDGMPKSARHTGVVDLELPPDQIADALHQFLHRGTSRLPIRDIIGPSDETALTRIVRLLRDQFQLDFAQYKSATVLRRIERRLAMLNIDNIDDYAVRVEADAGERELLYHDLLIGVTRFFRDAEAFDRLERSFMPRLLDRDPKEEIRVWLAGCATGEEAYSVAMLLHEFLTANRRPLNVKIFATDVHQRSLDHASNGVYTTEQLEEVREARRERYFSRVPDGWQVSTELRQMLVFAPHNVISDAPFTRLDLAICRNLLIYLQPVVQRKVLSLFHFSLRTGGLLFLGPSETPGELSDEFETLDSHWRLYTKRRDVRLSNVSLAQHSTPIRGKAPPPAVGQRQLLSGAYDQLLDLYMPAAILVDERYDILHVFGDADRFLKISPGRATNRVLDMVVGELKTPIFGALQHAYSRQKRVRFTGIESPLEDGENQTLSILVEPLNLDRAAPKQFLIVLESEAEKQNQTGVAEVAFEQSSQEQIESLETELRLSQENLQATVEELETTNEELQATNEELLASNEELQSSNEELHSVNEELYTVNSEHQRKIEELTEMTADMDSLLQGTDVGVIYLDRDLRVRRYTPRVADAFHLMPQDIGRRLNSFAHTIDHQDLLDELQQVLDNGRPIEHEVEDTSGGAYFMRILPYDTAVGRQGVLLTLIPIDSLRMAQTRIRQLSAIVESSDDAIISKDLDGTITSWNRGAEMLYGYSAEEAIGQSVRLIIPEDREDELESILERVRRGESIEQFETRRRRQDGSEVRISLRISPIRNAQGRLIGASAIGRNITGIRQRDELVRALMDATPQSIYGIDADGNCTFANAACVRELGYESEGELVGRNMHALIHHHRPDGSEYPREECKVYQAIQGRSGTHIDDEVLFRKDGTAFPAEYWSYPLGADTPAGAVVSFINISERLAVQSQLERLAAIVETTSDFVGVCDTSGNALMLNRAARSMFQLKPDDDVSHLSLSDFHPPEVVERLQREAIPTAREAGAWSGETILRLPGDRDIDVSQVIVPHRDARGKIEFYSTIIRDISQVKQAQQAVRLHQRAIDLASTGILITDARKPDNPLIYVNEGFTAITGYSVDETLGRNCRFLQGEDTNPATLATIREAIQNGQDCRVTVLNYRKDGQPFWNELQISAVRNAADEVTHFVGVQSDVTDRMQTERKLKQHNRVLRTLQTVSASLAAQLELDSLVQQVTDAGRELCEAEIGAFFYNVERPGQESYMLYSLSGEKAELLNDLPMPSKTEIFAPTFDGTYVVRSADITKHPSYGKSEPYFGMPAGHPEIRSYLAVPVKSRSGKVLGGLFYGHSRVGQFSEQSEQLVVGMAAQAAVAIDNARLYEEAQNEIQQRRRAELQLQEAKEAADAANRAKSSFLANMSHEIRTPMTTVVGMADLLLANEEDGEKVKVLNTLKESGNHLVEIINDILDLSRIEAGRMRVDRVACNPQRIVEGVAALFTQKVADKQIGLTCRVEGAIPESIQTDPVRFRQIVLNLISNAVKFTNEGGVTVTMRLREDDDPALEVVVDDSGIGIDPDKLPVLFQPFEQGDESISREYGGTGLGLVISKRLAEALGGTIDAESEPGKGSRFRLTVAVGSLDGVALTKNAKPYEAEAGSASPPGDELNACLDCRVLLAEDTPGIQFLISKILQAAGAEVVTAANGDEAVQRFEDEDRDGRIDVILMDMNMPQVDGYEATRRLRDKGCRQPIIALTANAMQGDREKCLAAGCDDFLTKPIDRRLLIEKIRQLTSN